MISEKLTAFALKWQRKSQYVKHSFLEGPMVHLMLKNSKSTRELGAGTTN